MLGKGIISSRRRGINGNGWYGIGEGLFRCQQGKDCEKEAMERQRNRKLGETWMSVREGVLIRGKKPVSPPFTFF